MKSISLSLVPFGMMLLGNGCNESSSDDGCSVVDNEDGTYTLTCEDGSEATLYDGVD